MAINNVVGQVIISLNQMWVGFAFNMMWASVLVGAVYLLVPQYGALGLSVANVIAYGLHTCWQMIYLKVAAKKHLADLGALGL
jgi:hypothetical protein